MNLPPPSGDPQIKPHGAPGDFEKSPPMHLSEAKPPIRSLRSEWCPTSATTMTSSSYRNYLLICLTTIFAFNNIDVMALGMALQSIKADLHLSDTELGLLSGLAFWLFYAGFGLPMGWWADRGSRVTILFVTRILWSILVMLTASAKSFLQLLFIRAGTAIGESGCLGPANSLISEYFAREERPRAFGIFYLGSSCGTLISLFASGWLMQLYGWRVMFTIIGLPGFLLALIARFTLKEPRKERKSISNFEGKGVTGLSPSQFERRLSQQPSIWQAVRTLCANATYRNSLLALVVAYFFTGNIQWPAAYFVREYGLTSGILGSWFSVIYGLPGLIGIPIGGMIASHWAKRNETMQLMIVALLYCSAGLTLTTVYLTHDYHVAFALIALSATILSLLTAPLFATLQTVVPPGLRAVSVMIVIFFANLIGSGLGPLFVGATSDLLRPIFGAESLRYALTMTGPWLLLSGWLVWRASDSVAIDIEAITD